MTKYLYHPIFGFSLAIVLLTLAASFFSFISSEWGERMKIATNVVFLVPIVISIYLKRWTFALVLLFTIIFSTWWHWCQHTENLSECTTPSSLDFDITMWAFFLATSFFVYANDYKKLFIWCVFLATIFNVSENTGPTWTGAPVTTLEFFLFFPIFAVAFIIRRFLWKYLTWLNLDKPPEYYWCDIGLAAVFIIIACILYFAFNDEHFNHCIWHICTALTFSLVITGFKDAEFHTFGFCEGMKEKEKEKDSLLRRC